MLPNLSRLSVRDDAPPTAGAAGREVEGDGNLRWKIAEHLLDSITTIEEACAVLDGDAKGADNRPQAVSSDVRAAVRLALRKEGEAFAERLLRADMGLSSDAGLPEGYASWLALLRVVCRRIRRLSTRAPAEESVLWQSRAVVLVEIKRHGWSLMDASERLKNDREVVLRAVKSWGLSLQYAPAFQADRELVLAAVRQNGAALRFGRNFLDDREMVLAAVNSDGSILSIVTNTQILDDFCVALRAVSSDGGALRHLSARLRNNPNVVRVAVSQDGNVLRWANKRFRKNREVVLRAVRQDGLALAWASEELQDDREVVRAALYQNGFALEYADEDLQDERDLVLIAVDQNGSAIDFASPKLRSDPEVRARSAARIRRDQELEALEEAQEEAHDQLLEAQFHA